MDTIKKRYNAIDFLRGFTIISMIIYHGIFDLENFYGFDFNHNFYYFQQYICISFILISGYSTHFSINFKKKFLILCGLSLLITLGSYVFSKEDAIYFGIIHFFAGATLVHMLIKKYIKKINPKLGLIVNTILFVCLKRIYYGSIFFGKIIPPKALYDLNLFILGIPSENFSSGDYFPLIPWIFLFYMGYF
ncbi:MAG: heparan-alpha-glucosaminide N-acetyltransferase domain-containing protein, partial [Peptoniphilus harei]|nr:heparan-alpha-glucosaminide N-acetyltransferase domain-containing protein [Peptoniphilus harei]